MESERSTAESAEITIDGFTEDELRVTAAHLGVTLPAWSVYGLGLLLIAIACAVPWLVRWQGFLRGTPVVPEREWRQLRPAMVGLPPGRFWMGSPASEAGRYEDEGPRRVVTISGFEICRTEVTQEQYAAVMENADNPRPSDCDYGCADDLPVNNVSWYDAIAYLNALSEREGLSPCYVVTDRGDDREVRWIRGCDGFRLPTEAEWEYAVRARSHTPYHFGDDPDRLGDYAWFADNADDRVHPALSKKPNVWGLYGMLGNVWEWVWDYYADSYEQLADDTVDPTGVPAADADVVVDEKTRVLRGGSFGGAGGLRSAYRYWGGPSNRNRVSGFRCARGVGPSLDPSTP